jgi:uncharacterized protein (TIGR03083 family)
MTSTITSLDDVRAIDHRDAMAIAATETDRMLDVVDRLDERDWTRPTDCAGWDVKALLSHVLGAMEGNRQLRTFVRQYLVANRAAKRSGRPMIDEMTAAQVRAHAECSPADLRLLLHEGAAPAVRGRTRIPALLRKMRFEPGPPVDGSWTFGYLFDTIMNRDYWMHRVDLARATGADLVLTAEHDGRIVADVVAEWARMHAQPFTLVLDGPAGGTFVHGTRGVRLQLDAVEFCRALSGRIPRSDLFDQEVPF